MNINLRNNGNNYIENNFVKIMKISCLEKLSEMLGNIVVLSF